jgi:hypothetical protein
MGARPAIDRYDYHFFREGAAAFTTELPLGLLPVGKVPVVI